MKKKLFYSFLGYIFIISSCAKNTKHTIKNTSWYSVDISDTSYTEMYIDSSFYLTFNFLDFAMMYDNIQGEKFGDYIFLENTHPNIYNNNGLIKKPFLVYSDKCDCLKGNIRHKDVTFKRLEFDDIVFKGNSYTLFNEYYDSYRERAEFAFKQQDTTFALFLESGETDTLEFDFIQEDSTFIEAGSMK